MNLFDFTVKDIGIDLGTANIVVTLKGKGIVLREPSVVAIDQVSGEILATGNEAKEMLGRTPEKIKAICPMKNGAIADFTATSLMLKNIMKKINREYTFGKMRIVAGIPSGITEVEKKAVQEAFFQSNAKEVYLVKEPIASAIGTGLNVLAPEGQMVVDIGGGTAEIAVISYGEIIAGKSIKVAGNAIDEAIIRLLKKNAKISIGQTTAESLKIELGSAESSVTEKSKEIRGMDVDTGLPKNETITSNQIEEAMKEPIQEIIEAIQNVLSEVPPEIASDLIDNGIYLTGGGALIKNLDNLIAQKTSIQTFIAETPLDCVAIGTGKIVEDLPKYQRIFR